MIIRDPEKLSHLLPTFFSTQSFISFVRQLNSYAFKKVSDSSKPCEYRNPLFRRGSREKIFLIERKKDKKRYERKKAALIRRDIDDFQAKMNRINRYIGDIKESVEQISEANNKIRFKLADCRWDYERLADRFKNLSLELLLSINRKFTEQTIRPPAFAELAGRQILSLKEEKEYVAEGGSRIFGQLVKKNLVGDVGQYGEDNFVLEQSTNILRETVRKAQNEQDNVVLGNKPFERPLIFKRLKRGRSGLKAGISPKPLPKHANSQRPKRDFSFLFKRKETDETKSDIRDIMLGTCHPNPL